MLDGAPIVCIATGFARRTVNAKTGDMIQIWVLRADINPVEAINTGADYSVCGDCRHRGKTLIAFGTSFLKTVNKMRSCYVKISQAPLAVWKCFKRGGYPEMSADDWAKLGKRSVRLGSYGDPTAVPFKVMSKLARVAIGHTGYTHQWRQGEFWRFRRIVMASVESYDDALLASGKGWRTFRTMRPGAQPSAGEFRCPASKEAGYRLDCAACTACGGASRDKGESQAVSVAITAHGSPAVMGSYLRAFSA